jgi:hypothetical protein
MSSPASSPDTSDVDVSDGPGPASSNLTLLYIIIAVLAGVLLYLAVRYGRSLLSEWRALHGNGAGDGSPTDTHLGLSMDEIAALPTFTYRARAAPTPSPQGSWSGKRRRSGSKGRAAALTSVECVVCLQELEDGDVVRVLPACRHFFHGNCIDAWLRAHSTCPVCRAHPEPERVRPGEAALSPPLPQLRRCDVSPERPTATRIFADILARSPLRIGGSTSGSKERIASRSPSPAPMVRDYVLSRSPSRTPLTHGMVDDERYSLSQSPQMLEVVVVRSPSPMSFGRQATTTCVGVLERTDASMSASPSPPATFTEESSSKLSPQVPH